ncbi:TPA: glycoside hydrolase family 31 protein [Salmonella bongori]|nr:glycoside hydrolase family 31 protein [Salmonella bongori]
MKTLKNWIVQKQFPHHVELLVDGQHTLCLYVLEETLFRVLVKRKGELALNRTWSIAPVEDVPWEGRRREDLSGFTLPAWTLHQQDGTLIVATESLRATIHQPLWIEWHYRNDEGKWQPLVNDRPTSAYLLNAHGDGVAHYQSRRLDERFYGLGDKAGDLQRTGKRYEMRNLDAMGYNAVSTDPLYKHIPFTITRRDDISFGLFYDNLSSCWLDLGNEIDNYHTAYRRWQAEAGDIDYYLFTGERVLDVTKAFVRLTGKTLFGPKWSLGYSGSTMHYTDAPDAQNQLMNFIRLCDEHAIPCDSFQLSSGYTSINGKRYVFNWNYDKVPQPKIMSQAFHDAGMHLAANIKPCLLQDHPRYHDVAEQGLFIRDSESDTPERSSFWDDEGSNLDFTNPQTIAWWQNGVMHPRFTIHSWNDDHTVNEPWMYPDVTPAIRHAIELRYRLLPYFYTLLWQAHADDEPMLRPTFLDHEHDAQTFEECDDFLLGRDMLVASVVSPGERKRRVWLPANQTGWYDFYTSAWFSGGQWITLDAPLEKLPLLVRAGAGLPLSDRIAYVKAAADTSRELKLFPVKGAGVSSGLLFEDDGESWGYKEGHALWLEWEMTCTATTIDLTINTRGDYRPAWKALKVSLPAEEKRTLRVNGEDRREWIR